MHGHYAAFILVGLSLACGRPGPEPSRGARSFPEKQESMRHFDVISVRPSYEHEPMSFDLTKTGLSAHAMPAVWYILQAYSDVPAGRLRPGLVHGAPEWIFRDGYDVEARVDPAVVPEIAHMSDQELGAALAPMLQDLLATRFGLKVHIATSTKQAYALYLARKIANIHLVPGVAVRSAGGIDVGDEALMTWTFSEDKNRGAQFHNISMSKLAEVPSGFGTDADPVVVDQTGLKGRFDFILWKRGDLPDKDDSAPGVPGPLQWDVEKLGLGLRRTVIAEPTVVVEAIHKPTEN